MVLAVVSDRSSWKRAILALLSLAAAANASWGGAVAHLRPTAMVHGTSIRLADVARIDGDPASAQRLGAVEVGSAPLPGLARGIYAENVRVRLRQEKLDPALLAADSEPSCRVSRACQKLSPDRLVDTARKAVEAQVDSTVGKVVVEPITHPREMTLPEGALELTAEVAGGTATASTRRVMVRASVNGTPCGQADVAIRVRCYANVAVASAAIPRGETLTVDRIRFEERDRNSLPSDVLTDADSLDGLQTVQPVAAGAALTRRMAALPAVVHRGDTVTIQAHIGGIQVSAQGVAMEDGRSGQVIRVRTGSASQESRATVVDSRTVEAAP